MSNTTSNKPLQTLTASQCRMVMGGGTVNSAASASAAGAATAAAANAVKAALAAAKAKAAAKGVA